MFLRVLHLFWPRKRQIWANLISPDQLSEEYIIPSIFDKRVVQVVASAVAEAAHKTGVAQRRAREEMRMEIGETNLD